MKKKTLLSLLLIILILAACGNEEPAIENNTEKQSESEKVLELYTTIFPLEDFAKKIGGEHVHVTNLVPVGADAHTFEPTVRDMIQVADGDAFIYNGAGLEGFVDAVLETVEGEGVTTVKASEQIPLLQAGEEHGSHEEENDLHDHGSHEEEHDHDSHGEEHHHSTEDHHHHSEDPHVWLDPILSISLAENIKDTLIELMPEHEETFVNNFEGLKEELEAIDLEFSKVVEEATNDTFLVSHAGYGYWEKRYGIKQIGITGLSPTNEPSQRQLQTIIEYAKENEAKYVMFEQNIPTKIADVVKNAIGAEGLILHNLETLTEEDMKNGEDYSSLMRKNIEQLGIALN